MNLVMVSPEEAEEGFVFIVCDRCIMITFIRFLTSCSWCFVCLKWSTNVLDLLCIFLVVGVVVCADIRYMLWCDVTRRDVPFV